MEALMVSDEEAAGHPLSAALSAELSGNGDDTAPCKDKETEAAVAQRFCSQVDELISKADEMERRVKEVADYHANKKQLNCSKGSSSALREKFGRFDGSQKEVICLKRMHEVMRQFGTVLKQLTQHKWAFPFMDPVDVEGLHLCDYYEVIKKPMDFTTIRKKMEASVYKNVREIYADVRLVFSNAMTYNEEKSNVYVMAKTLLERLEEKWLQLLPKVIEAETRQREEEAVALANMQIAQEAAITKLARDTNNELNKMNLHLEKLRESVIQRCRKMSTSEKRNLSVGLSLLQPDYVDQALEIIAQGNPNSQVRTEEVEIDIDAQSEITLRRLKFFVKGALENQAKEALQSQVKVAPGDQVKRAPENQAKTSTSPADEISKRKKVFSDALATIARKKSKKLPK